LLSTERLELWRPAPHDHAALVAQMADEDVRRALGSPATGPAEEFNRLCRHAGSWALYGYGSFMCRMRGQDAVIGICGVFHSWRGFGERLDDTPEIGYSFARQFWGQGLATEAGRTALAWFDTVHGSRRISCMINETNLGSLAVAAKLGFVRYGTHVDEHETLALLERIG
jgi:RimJ/RimL family protein N-acetyltransferase